MPPLPQGDAASKRPRVVVLDDWEGALQTLADWSWISRRCELRFHRQSLFGSALHDALADAEVVVLNRDRTPMPAALVDALPALRYLVYTGPRNLRVDFEALQRRGIPVSCTAGGPALESTCEHAWALIFAWARRVDEQARLVRSGGWRADPPLPLPRLLHGERLGLVGCGRIGSRMAAVARALGMEVVTWSPHMTADRAAAAGAAAVALDELLRTSLVVSLHLVPTPPTRHLIDRERLALMRRDALLVNTARADLVDSDALADALRGGIIDAAALDVLPREPPASGDPLRAAPRLLITPHIGYGCGAVLQTFAQGAAACVAAWLDGGELPHRVDV